MKKLTKIALGFIMVFMISIMFVFTGCKKPTGTFYLDNSTGYSMDVSWSKYNMSVGAYGFNSYTVEAGSATAEVYANGYGYWGSLYFNVPEGGSNTLYMYWGKKKDGTKTIVISPIKPDDWVQKKSTN